MWPASFWTSYIVGLTHIRSYMEISILWYLGYSSYLLLYWIPSFLNPIFSSCFCLFCYLYYRLNPEPLYWATFPVLFLILNQAVTKLPRSSSNLWFLCVSLPEYCDYRYLPPHSGCFFGLIPHLLEEYIL